MKGAVRAWLELARLSNAPTVVTNVLVGVAIAGPGAGVGGPDLVLLAGSMLLLYVGGMALNDLVDRGIDAVERPGRPLPSGRVTPVGAGVLVAACLGLGVAGLASFGPRARLGAGVLVAAIVVYDLVHKKHAASAVLMGLCRGLVYVTVALAVTRSMDWTRGGVLAAAITAYTAVLTLLARGEAGEAAATPRGPGALALVPIALAPALVVRPPDAEGAAWAAGAGTVCVAWLLLASRHVLARPPRPRRAVLGWLSGMCLVDAYFLTLLDRPAWCLAALACFAATALGHRLILGT